jgi:hypothetical protein
MCRRTVGAREPIMCRHIPMSKEKRARQNKQTTKEPNPPPKKKVERAQICPNRRNRILGRPFNFLDNFCFGGRFLGRPQQQEPTRERGTKRHTTIAPSLVPLE